MKLPGATVPIAEIPYILQKDEQISLVDSTHLIVSGPTQMIVWDYKAGAPI